VKTKLGMGIAAFALAAGSLTGMASPAAADHDYRGYDDGYYDDSYGRGYDDRDGRECRGGGCGNERDEDYSNGGCKYICPQDSPITDSFNVCLPGATCHWDGQRDGQNGGQGGQGGQDEGGNGGGNGPGRSR
jgi:hypothetical protein